LGTSAFNSTFNNTFNTSLPSYDEPPLDIESSSQLPNCTLVECGPVADFLERIEAEVGEELESYELIVKVLIGLVMLACLAWKVIKRLGILGRFFGDGPPPYES